MKTRFLAFAALGLVPLCTGALAQRPWPERATVVRGHAGGRARDMGAPYLIGLEAALANAYPVIGANADGTDLWPCVNYQGVNPDCPALGNPSVPFPSYGIVTGFPAYSWTLANTPGRGNGIGCDAAINGTGTYAIPYKPCAQITTWFEDGTSDSTDDLLWHVRVVQGAATIYDSGLVDYGPAGPTVVYPVEVVLSQDANFGLWPGAGTGRNNGNCFGDALYPLSAPAFPGRPYSVASGRRCVEPHAGPAKVLTETVLATPAYAEQEGRACTAHGVASPCYTVSWTERYRIHQDFSILLQ